MLTDLRYSLRKLAQSPGFTLTALAALALGIGANTSIFSVVNSVLLRPLPYPDSHRLAYIWEVSPRSGNRTNSVNPGNYNEWRARNRSFERVAGFFANNVNLTGQGEPEQIKSATVTQDFFPVMGLVPALGRDFSNEEAQPNGPSAVILSHNLWIRRYAADPNIIGRRVQINGRETTVIGVAPKGFNYPRNSEAWNVYSPRPTWRGRYMTVIARLKPGAGFQPAQSDMEAIMHQLRAEHADFNAKWGVNVMPMKDYETKDVKLALLVLLGAVGFVLLIACANVANLMLIRATGRAREIAVRASIGAGRWHLARQLIVESLLLALTAGALGLLFGAWLTDVLIALTPENLALRNLTTVALDSRVLLFTLAASLFTGLLFGLTPALRASRIDLYEALKASRAPSGGLRRNRYRAALVIAEVALSMILLIGAGLLGRSFSKLMAVPPGFDPEQTLTLNVEILNRQPPQSAAFLEQLLERVRAIPGVRAAGSTHFIPLTAMYSGTGFWRADRPVPAPGDQPVCEVSVITSGYFAAMGIPLQKGRLFDQRDIAATPRVVVINQLLANQFFPNEDPIGKQLSIQWGDKPYQIVGVVGDIHSRGLEKKPMPHTYLHNLQEPINLAHLVIRTTADPNQTAGLVKQAIREQDPNIPVSNMRTLEYYLSASVASQRFNAILLGGFSGIALLLAVIGVFGVISYTVSQRTQEIGIRMALGARGRDVSRLVIFEGMTLALIGIAIGIAGAAALTRFLSTLLFNVQPLDLPTFLGVSFVLGAAALAAAWLPARRAAKVDPMISLRYE